MSDTGSFQRLSGKPDKKPGTAFQRFDASMRIGYYEWHDGIGYDLDALKELSPEETRQIESLLIARKDNDWRDVEALAALRTGAAIQALKDCLASSNLECRLFAVRYLKEMGIADHVEEVVVKTLPETRIGEGLTYALNLAREYPSQRVRDTILRCALNGHDDLRVHCAAMTLFLFGLAQTEAESYQEIVYEFNNKDFAARMDPFMRLCRMVDIDPKDFLK